MQSSAGRVGVVKATRTQDGDLFCLVAFTTCERWLIAWELVEFKERDNDKHNRTDQYS